MQFTLKCRGASAALFAQTKHGLQLTPSHWLSQAELGHDWENHGAFQWAGLALVAVVAALFTQKHLGNKQVDLEIKMLVSIQNVKA